MNFIKSKTLKILFLLHCASMFVAANIQPMQIAVSQGIPNHLESSIDTKPFVKIGEKYYFFETTNPMNWYDAAHDCRRRNANLASVESAAEYDYLNAYFASMKWTMYFWTAGNDLAKEGAYYWLDSGNSLGFTRWGLGQPDNYKGNEHCLQLWFKNNQYSLNDAYCFNAYSYICEIKPKTVALTLW